MATADRLTISVPSDLMDRARAAGLSPSEVFQTALRERLGDDGVKSTADQLAELRQLVTTLESTVGKLGRDVRALKRKPA